MPEFEFEGERIQDPRVWVSGVWGGSGAFALRANPRRVVSYGIDHMASSFL